MLYRMPQVQPRQLNLPVLRFVSVLLFKRFKRMRKNLDRKLCENRPKWKLHLVQGELLVFKRIK